MTNILFMYLLYKTLSLRNIIMHFVSFPLKKLWNFLEQEKCFIHFCISSAYDKTGALVEWMSNDDDDRLPQLWTGKAQHPHRQ